MSLKGFLDFLRKRGWRMLRALFEGALESDDDGRARMRALETVGRLGGPEGLELAVDLVRGYDDIWLSDRRVARAWQRALGHVLATDDGTMALARPLARVPTQLQQATAEALVAADASEAVPLLVEMLAARPRGAAALLRVLAASRRIDLAQVDGGDLVDDYLEDAHADVRIATLRLVGHMGLRDQVPAVIERLADEDPRVRRAALGTLRGLTGTNRGPTVGAWHTWLENEARWWRDRRIEERLAAEAVGEVAAALRAVVAHPYASAPALRSVQRLAARHAHAGVRTAAVAALRALGSLDAVEVLVQALQDEAPGVSRGAHAALVAITGARWAPDDEAWHELATG